MENSKRSDKIIYIIIKILSIITGIIVSYFIVYLTMMLMNTSDFSKILIDLNVYRIFYNILNIVGMPVVWMFLITFILAIPYLLISIIVGIIFARKYINNREKKLIIKNLVFFVVTLFIIIKGFSLYPGTSKYELKVNSKISEISNVEVKEFLEKVFEEDKYVYKIRFDQGFPDDYHMYVHYRDITYKVEKRFISDSYFSLIDENAKNITDILGVISIIITLVGYILYIYFVRYILKEFKRISNN